VPCWLAAAPPDVINSPSVTSGQFATQSNNGASSPDGSAGAAARHSFPKTRRILKSADFKRVYTQGSRLALSSFAAFFWRSPESGGPRIGFTAPRALGRAVARNRMKRRVREAIRVRLSELEPNWWIVINLRRASLDAPFEQIRRDVDRLVKKCVA